MNKRYRKLDEQEKRIIERLLSAKFPGKKAIQEQISTCLVRSITEYNDNWGSIEFKVNSDQKARVISRIPVQGIVNDSDGVPLEIFLHVVDGKVYELDIGKADNSPLKKPIDPRRIKVITYDEVIKE